ncbi:MAG: response regulator transcription factor [Bifidobacteriaceae bacterium]|nr:response regulator transcription factor [Bifidobacteriaceae bacterium]
MSESTEESEGRVDPRTKPHAVIHQGIPASALRPATGSAPATAGGRVNPRGRSAQYPRSGQYPRSDQFPATGQRQRTGETPRRLIRTGPPYSAADVATTGGAIRRTARVGIVDQETLFRTMVVDALSQAPDLKVVASLDSVAKARESLPGRVDLLIADVEQKDGSGAVLAAELQRIDPRLRVIIMTRHDVTSLISSSRRHLRRPWASVSKLSNIGREGLVELVRRVAMDVPQPVAPGATRRDPFEGLTGQQMAVLRLIADGYTNQQVAEQLGLSRRTVENHLLAIYRGLDIADEEVNPRVAAALLLLSKTLDL